MTIVSRGWVGIALGAGLALTGPAIAQTPPQMPMQAPAGPQLMQPGAPGYQGPMGQGGWMQPGQMQPGPMQQGGQAGPGSMMGPGGPMMGPGPMMGGPGQMGGPGPMMGGPGQMGGPGPMMGGPGQMGGPGHMMGGPGMQHGRGPGMMQGRGCPMMGGGDHMGGPGKKQGHSCPMMGKRAGDDDGEPTFLAGRIAFLKAELGITEAQLPAFEELAGALRGMLERTQSGRMSMPEGAEHMGALGERLASRISAMETRLLAMKELKQALDKLYGAMTEEQRQRADQALRFGMGRLL